MRQLRGLVFGTPNIDGQSLRLQRSKEQRKLKDLRLGCCCLSCVALQVFIQVALRKNLVLIASKKRLLIKFHILMDADVHLRLESGGDVVALLLLLVREALLLAKPDRQAE